ncbi:flagellar protein FliS [Lachnobacterium bovis]|uniref:Flagellar protein FliS n=1 Tax=Lachnobacterium bovis TaxID=140626 RepID=A0A1H9SVB4_9FIRM|nr:flagellar protein FliS [Lachnobacterium bovis]SER88861.1 flagellar protein FliS [Lachnobacterium bovis]
MTQEKIQEFTRRLSQCNKSELTIINYEIAFTYMEDAESAYNNGDYAEFKKNIEWAEKAIEELRSVLNFEYELSNNLNEIYLYCNRSLSESVYKNETNGIKEAKKLLEKLYESFRVAAESDNSGSMMDNVQNVYAGITYSKNDLNETYTNDSNRGFLA